MKPSTSYVFGLDWVGSILLQFTHGIVTSLRALWQIESKWQGDIGVSFEMNLRRLSVAY
jgi:hypothetical protein